MNTNNNENTYSDRKLRLMELMRTLNLNQSQFAEKIEVEQSNVSKMLSGKRPIGRNIINKLVLAFDINKDWMLTGYGEMFDSSRVSNPFHLEDVDLNTSEKEERINAITAEIQKGVNEAREAIKPYGATIPKSDIVVIIKDGKGMLQAIKTINVKKSDMNIKELLNKELSFEEMNELLNELMDYGCNSPADSSERFYVYDDEGDICDFRKHIGMKALNTLSGILFLKEKIDEERGEWRGRYDVQQSIKQALGIN